MRDRARRWLVGLLLPFTLVGCDGGEEVFLRCVDVDAPTLSWFLFQFEEGAEIVRVESGLGAYMGDRGGLETTEAAYRISVPLPDASGVDGWNEFRIDRISGDGRMSIEDESGDVIEGSLTLTCERVEPDERL